MSETYYRVCPDGCEDGRIPVYGYNGLQTGDEPCETCQGSGYVALPAGSVLLDAATAATAAEACERMASEERFWAADADARQLPKVAEVRRAARDRYMAAAAALREGGR